MPDLSIYLKPAAIWAPFVIRLVLGIIFMAHGAQKLFGLFGGGGISGTTQFMQSLSIPLPAFSAWIVALVEFLGGLFLVIGLFTRIVSVLIIIDMVVAVALIHGRKGFFAGGGGFEYNLALIAMALSLVLSGPGAFALYRSDRWPF
ncbi:MAG: DoxX family protein [Armatimonadota bacterium]